MANDSRITLVLGGARSGKSAYAQELAAQCEPILFVATGVAVDDEMTERIAAHRASRPTGWQCVEAPTGVGRAICQAPQGFAVALVDCVSFLVSNCILAEEAASAVEPTERAAWPRIEDEIADLLAAARSREAGLIVVSTEVGMSVVPEYPLGRVYRDVLGRANQRLARAADAVYLMVAGIPIAIKPSGVTPPSRER